MSVFTVAWWKAAAWRAGRTAAAVAIPYVPLTLAGQDYLALGSVALVAAFLSILTSLTGIPEAEGEGRPWYYSLFARTGKTVAQALLTASGAAVFLTDIDWSAVPALVASAAVGSILLFFSKGAPEVTLPATSAPPVEVVSVAPAAAIEVVEAVEAAPLTGPISDAGLNGQTGERL